MVVAILDYRAGNVTSVAHAVRACGAEAVVTYDHDVIDAADKIIFPGVGAAKSCMAQVRERGLDLALQSAISAGKPVFGICVGMQLLFDYSEEDGGVECLGLLPGRVRRFELDDPQLKVPHMGWNPVTFRDEEPLAKGLAKDLSKDTACYFVHSYYCDPAEQVEVIARADHGHEFCVGVRRGNLVALQCHPEKSGTVGMTILHNFLQA